MPHEPATSEPRSRFRVSLRWAMSAVVVVACMLAAWHATRAMRRPTMAWLVWIEQPTGNDRDKNNRLFDAALARLTDRATDNNFALGVHLVSPSGTRVLGIQGVTGDPRRDVQQVNAAVVAFLENEPPGTLRLLSRVRPGDRWNEGSTFSNRILISLAAGLVASIGLVALERSLHMLAARRSHLRRLTLPVAGAAHDPQR